MSGHAVNRLKGAHVAGVLWRCMNQVDCQTSWSRSGREDLRGNNDWVDSPVFLLDKAIQAGHAVRLQ